MTGKKFIPLLMFLITLLFCACGQIYDGPPKEPDTPLPAPHNGTFVSDHGTLTFNGDGKSVTVEFDEELAESCGLPAGRSEGKYLYMVSTPPHYYNDRYDVASDLDIYIGEGDDEIKGNIQLNIGWVTEEEIPTAIDLGGEYVVFKKE